MFTGILGLAGGLLFLTWIYPEYVAKREVERLDRRLSEMTYKGLSHIESMEDQNQDGYSDLTYRDIGGRQHIIFGYKDGKFYSSKSLLEKKAEEK